MEVLVFQWRLPSRIGDGRALKTRGRGREAEVLVFQWRLPSRLGDGRALKTRGRSRLLPVEPKPTAAGGTEADCRQWNRNGAPPVADEATWRFWFFSGDCRAV